MTKRALSLAVALTAAPLSAFQAPPAGRVLADYDRGGAVTPVAPVEARRAALRALKDQVGAPLVVGWSRDTGTVRRLNAGGRPLARPAGSSPEEAARAALERLSGVLGAPAAPSELALRFVESASSGLVHVGFEQHVDGARVLDGFVRVDLDRRGEPVAVDLADSRLGAGGVAAPGVPIEAAVEAAAAEVGVREPRAALRGPAGGRSALLEVGGLREPAAAELVWLPAGSGLRLVWRVELAPPGYPARYEVVVDAASGEPLRRRNLYRYADTRANVFVENPDRGPRRFETLYDAAVNVSPFFPAGWIDADRTEGNNIVARDDRAGDDETTLGVQPLATPGSPQVFDPPFTADPIADLDLGVVNLFWAINRFHQHFYGLGFDEAAGNFQRDNFGRAGAGGDPVLGDAQDEADTLLDADPGNDVDNNANFFTPPDGQSGRVQMYLWTTPAPRRDGDLDVDIVIHELTHGVSTRLVGGRRDVGCLFGVQSGAMGEGWGDFFAGSFFDDAVLAEYATQDATRGIRTAPLDADTYTYGDLCSVGTTCEVHDDGEIWAQNLWELRATLVAALGLDSGRQAAEQLVVDGMKLSPCNPSFLDARDAILLADEIRNGGAFRCLIWQVFASNGMGLAAQDSTAGDETNPVEDGTVPDDCRPGTAGVASIRWQFATAGCDSSARVRVADADLVLPATVEVRSAAGDRLVLPLVPGPAGPPVYLTAWFPVQGVPSPASVDPGNGVLEAVRGDALTATHRVSGSSTDVTDSATLSCLADVRFAGHRFRRGTCDADSVPGFPELPGFLDGNETAVLEVDLENHEPFDLVDVEVQVGSSNPNVTIVPLGPRRAARMPAATGTAPGLATFRFLASAGPVLVTPETADLSLGFVARGYDGLAAPISWTIRLNLDYQVNARSFAESFDPGSPTLAGWTHAPLKTTPSGDEWRLVTCQSASPTQSYKNGGGDPGCGNYTDNQGDPFLASPPLLIAGPGTEAARLTALSFNHHVRLGVPSDPFGGVCDAEAVGLLLSNDPAAIDTSDPFALIDEALAVYTVIPALGLDDNTTGFVPVRLDLGARPLPGVDLTRDAYLTWVFAVDVTNAFVPAPGCSFFPATGQGYGLDDVLLEWEEVVAVPQGTSCTTSCLALADAEPDGAQGCPGDVLAMSGSDSLVANCPGGQLEYRWSGGPLGPGNWGLADSTTVSVPSSSVFQLDVRCAADPACTDSTSVVFEVLSGKPPAWGPIGNRLLAARTPAGLHFDWSARPLLPRDYNLHQATTKAETDDATIASTPIAARVTDAETYDLTAAAGDAFFEVYGRDGCTGGSVVP